MYSLGCTFYYLLTGVPPFPGGDITDKLTRHAKNPPPDVRDLRPDLPVELSAILLKLMAKRPEDRLRLVRPTDGRDRSRAASGRKRSARNHARAGLRFRRCHERRLRIRRLAGVRERGAAHQWLSGSDDSAGFTRRADGGGRRSGCDPRTDCDPTGRTGTAAVAARGLTPSLDSGETVRSDSAEEETSLPTGQSIPWSAWMIPGVFLCAAMVILGIGVFHSWARMMRQREYRPGRGRRARGQPGARSRADVFAACERGRCDGRGPSFE